MMTLIIQSVFAPIGRHILGGNITKVCSDTLLRRLLMSRNGRDFGIHSETCVQRRDSSGDPPSCHTTCIDAGCHPIRNSGLAVSWSLLSHLELPAGLFIVPVRSNGGASATA